MQPGLQPSPHSRPLKDQTETKNLPLPEPDLPDLNARMHMDSTTRIARSRHMHRAPRTAMHQHVDFHQAPMAARRSTDCGPGRHPESYVIRPENTIRRAEPAERPLYITPTLRCVCGSGEGARRRQARSAISGGMAEPRPTSSRVESTHGSPPGRQGGEEMAGWQTREAPLRLPPPPPGPITAGVRWKTYTSERDIAAAAAAAP